MEEGAEELEMSEEGVEVVLEIEGGWGVIGAVRWSGGWGRCCFCCC